MKKIKKMLAVTLLFMSFISIETKSEKLDILVDNYCAGTYNCGTYSYFCAVNSDRWIAGWYALESFYCEVQ